MTASWGAQVYGRYRVQPGDTLRSISERLLGDPDRWNEIYNLNRKSIGDNPSNLKRDTILLIPIPEDRLQSLIQRPLEKEEKPESPSPSPVLTPAPSPPPGGSIYLVKPGDGLMGIARRELNNPGRWKEIYGLNRPTIGKNPNLIREGMTLSLPEAERSIGAAPARPDEYVTQQGDTLYKIARKLYRDQRRWRDIYEKNRGLIGKNPNRLKAGMKLALPEGRKAP